MFKNKFSLFLISVLIFVIAVEAVVLWHSKFGGILTQSKSALSLSEKDRKDYQEWAKRVDEQGAEKTYEEFKKAYENADPGIAHLESHIIGQVIYDKMGVDGTGICDKTFAFGCYHSFLGHAISENGLAIVDMLNQKCIEKLVDQALGCQHGIGHGLVTYLGYEYGDLADALEACDKLPVSDPIGGCFGGAFMEYNFRTMLADKASLREYKEEFSHEPCKSLSEKFVQACYYWQSQWWGNVLSESYSRKYVKIGEFCAEISIDVDRRQCFWGAGNTVGQFVSWDVSEAIKLCKLLSGFEGELYCRSGAAGAFYAEPSKRSLAPELCDGLDEKPKESCKKAAKGSAA